MNLSPEAQSLRKALGSVVGEDNIDIRCDDHDATGAMVWIDADAYKITPANVGDVMREALIHGETYNRRVTFTLLVGTDNEKEG